MLFSCENCVAIQCYKSQNPARGSMEANGRVIKGKRMNDEVLHDTPIEQCDINAATEVAFVNALGMGANLAGPNR